MVALSSLDVRALALELRALEDAFVDKVYQTGPSAFILKLRKRGEGATHLVIEAGAYAARVDDAPPTPESPSALAMALRKNLGGARIRRVDQHEFDRVLRFQLERAGETMELVVELFGKGNLILAGPDRTIILALRSETFAHRTIKRGEPLVFPPARMNPANLPRTQFEDLARASERDVVRFLAVDLGLGGELAEEVCHRAGLNKKAKAKDLPLADLDRAFEALRSLLESPPAPAVVEGPKGPLVQSMAYQSPPLRDARREPAATLSAAILDAAKRESQVVQEAAPDEELDRLRRQIEHQERALVALDAEAGQWERRGHLLYANYATAERVLQKSKAAVQAQGWEALGARIKAPPAEGDAWSGLLASVDKARARIVLRLEEDEVPLDPLQSLEANATLLYDEAKRLRAKLESAREHVEKARKQLSVHVRKAERAVAPEKAQGLAKGRRFWFESHRWFFTSESFLVVAGRDAAANEKLVKRNLAPGDRYVHADVAGAASVVLKGEGREPGPASLRQACAFAGVNSKAFQQFETADAYWVLPEQVSKTAESGEYVAKGSFVVRGKRNYEPKLEMVLEVGVLGLDAGGRPGGPDAPYKRLVAGPPEAMAAHAPRRARIGRGDRKPSDVAKELAPLFGASIDEVVAALPAGTLRILSKPEAAA